MYFVKNVKISYQKYPPPITAPANKGQNLQAPSRPLSRGYTVLSSSISCSSCVESGRSWVWRCCGRDGEFWPNNAREGHYQGYFWLNYQPNGRFILWSVCLTSKFSEKRRTSSRLFKIEISACQSVYSFGLLAWPANLTKTERHHQALLCSVLLCSALLCSASLSAFFPTSLLPCFPTCSPPFRLGAKWGWTGDFG